MDHHLLKKLIHWISNHEFSSYTPETIAHDLNIDIQYFFTPAVVFDTVFSIALSTALEKTVLQHPATEDELFDLILTFFEELSDYKLDLEKIFNAHKLTLDYIQFMPMVDKLTRKIFHHFIHTLPDKFTYGIIFIKIFHVWLNDTTEDFSYTSNNINHIAKIICHQP